MKAIQTRYLPASPVRDIRVKAWGHNGVQTTILFDKSESVAINMRKVALNLLKKLGVDGGWVGDELPSGDWAFICIEFDEPLRVGVYND